MKVCFLYAFSAHSNIRVFFFKVYYFDTSLDQLILSIPFSLLMLPACSIMWTSSLTRCLHVYQCESVNPTSLGVWVRANQMPRSFFCIDLSGCLSYFCFQLEGVHSFFLFSLTCIDCFSSFPNQFSCNPVPGSSHNFSPLRDNPANGC